VNGDIAILGAASHFTWNVDVQVRLSESVESQERTCGRDGRMRLVAQPQRGGHSSLPTCHGRADCPIHTWIQPFEPPVSDPALDLVLGKPLLDGLGAGENAVLLARERVDLLFWLLHDPFSCVCAGKRRVNGKGEEVGQNVGRMAEERLYFRQLLAGRDFARDDQIAQQMVNFVYLIGDRETGEAVAVDPAYDPAELVDILAGDGMKLTGALVTHYHPDHIGGSLGGWTIAGARELLELPGNAAKLHIQADEAHGTKRVTGCSDSDLVLHSSGDVLDVGAIRITMIHTPGHTPGSQCFHVDGRLVSGDTLFLDGCGRTDLPGGNPEQLYESLTQKLSAVPDDTVLYPGHMYSAEPNAPMGEVRTTNFVFRPRTREQWLMMFGH
jgi:glyoxylase-like metal-dependent hydrolase (beta-lactamase superfamily II)